MSELRLLIESRSIPVPESGCWIWLGGCGGKYGDVTVGKRRVGAHRLSYEAYHGPPEGKLVCHRCDVPLCVNPDHLFLGSAEDNSADMVRKKRQGRPAPKLTEDAVKKIRESEKTDTKLAREYGVSIAAVNYARRGVSWGRVAGDGKGKRQGRPPATHCKRGHEFTAGSTAYNSRGHKICLACKSNNRRREHNG